jgi:hypothetical protein
MPGRTGEIAGFYEVAIITGTARRRRFSLEEKMRVVAESLDPAVSVSAVASRRGINPKRLRHDPTLQCLRPLPPSPDRGRLPGVHRDLGGHFCRFFCHMPIIAGNDDQW